MTRHTGIAICKITFTHTVSCFVFCFFVSLASGIIKSYTPNDIRMTKMPRDSVYWQKKKCTSQLQARGCVTLICIRVWVILVVEDPTVTVKCRTAIKAPFLYSNLCLSVKLYSLSCSFTSISLFNNRRKEISECETT